LAEFVIAKGLAREILKDEAIKILAASEKEAAEDVNTRHQN